MAKAKFDFKKLLVSKGEYIALGISGFFLALMLLTAANRWSSAKDPSTFATPLKSSAQRVYSEIENGTPSEEDKKKTELPPWIKTKASHKDVSVRDFPASSTLFDPIAQPNTKKENPVVYPIGSYQVDLVRAPMKGFDIITDNQGSLKIAVVSTSKIGKVDQDKVKKVGEQLKGNKGGGRPKDPKAGGQTTAASNPYGNASSAGYDGSAERIEKNIEYVPLDEVDKAIAEDKAPAMTVIPLRMVLIHAEVPLKDQIAQFQKALRLPNTAEASKVGPIYDGYEIRRRVTRVLPSGKEEVLSDWALYDFEEKYADLINARKMADNFEDGYLAHFIRYEQALALPLPQLVPELGKYPDIRREGIKKTIKGWEDAKKPKLTPSQLAERLKNGKKDLYKPQTGEQTGASNIYNSGEIGGPTSTSPRPGGGGGTVTTQPKDNTTTGATATATPSDVEHLLLRFVDVDVKPGYTYQYQIRLRIKNPNFGKRGEVANPSYADKEFLESKWAQINTPITIPAESYLFAVDVASFRKRIDEGYSDQPALLKALQVKDNQAVVEMCTWMEEVRTDSAGKREPVGAWVVADIPVGRGEYIGRKQYIKLPLWSSENRAYLLRELQDMVIPKGPPGGKEPPKPKGWLVDFSTKNVLVDFEGGKVRTKVGVRDPKEVLDDVATELLIVRSDNKLVVKRSVDDEVDENRTTIAGGWKKWIDIVSVRKDGAAGSSEYDKNKPKDGGR